MATLAGLKCPSCLAHGVTSHLGSNGVCGRCWRKADEEAAKALWEALRRSCPERAK